MKKITLRLTEHQLVKLNELYYANFKRGKKKKSEMGVILGHPDLNSMKIQFHVFKYHEYLILRVAVILIRLLRGQLHPNKTTIDPYGFYSLWQYKVE